MVSLIDPKYGRETAIPNEFSGLRVSRGRSVLYRQVKYGWAVYGRNHTFRVKTRFASGN